MTKKKKQSELFDEDPYDIPREELLTKSQREIVEFDEFNLNEEFKTFAGRHADWTAIYSKAYKKSKIAKHNDEIAYAKAFLKARETYIEDEKGKEKKPSNEEAKMLALLDEDRIKAHKKAVLADAEREKTKTFLNSIESKKEMLRSIGAKLRAEMEGDLAVRDYIKDEEARRKKSKNDD